MIRVNSKAGFVAVKISHFAAGALLALALSSGSASANPAWKNCSEALYQEAVNLWEEGQAGQSQGIFSGFDVSTAEMDVLDLGLCAGKISKEEYCQRKGAIVESEVANLRRLADSGIPMWVSRRSLLAWKADLASVCGAKGRINAP